VVPAGGRWGAGEVVWLVPATRHKTSILQSACLWHRPSHALQRLPGEVT